MTCRFSNRIAVVEFADAVLMLFDKHLQRNAWSSEAGGQLFSRLANGVLTVDMGTAPSSLDKRSRYSFWPNRKHEQGDIMRNYDVGLHYIGDWHTHAEDQPEPSSEDVRKIQDIFKKSQHELKYMLLVVVGRCPFPEGLWVGLVNRDEVLHLKPSE